MTFHTEEPKTREERLREYWNWYKASEDPSKSGMLVSPTGWRSAVGWLLVEVDRLERHLAEAEARK